MPVEQARPSTTRAPLRCLHVVQPTTEGTAEVVRHLVTWGLQQGHEVTVACPSGGWLADWVAGSGARWVRLGLIRSPTWRDLGHVLAVRRLLARSDLVHAHSSKAGAVARLAGATRSRRPPLVFLPHGWSWLVGGRAAPVYRRFERWAATRCDAIVTVSDQERDDGFSVLGSNAEVVLIENGVDTDRFTPAGARAPRGAGPLLVCVGRLSRQKGQDLLLRALARLRHTDVRLRLVGDGPAAADLDALALELGVADRVERVGHDVPAPHLRAADVVVLPSRWEGLALALLESMAVGSVVVASDRGSVAALGDAGVVVPLQDEDDFVVRLADELDRLLDDPSARAALRERARTRVVEAYSLQRTQADYLTLWRRLVG